MNVTQILAPDIMYALGWSLIHSLWQGAVIAILLALSFLLFKKATSTFRYRLSISSLALVFVLFIGTFIMTFNSQKSAENDVIFISDNGETVELIVDTTPTMTANSINFLSTYVDYFNTHLPFIVTLWLLGMVIFSLRFLGGLAYTQRLRHTHHSPMSFELEAVMNEVKTTLGIRQNIELVASSLINVPMVIGYLKPMILMPLGVVNHLSISEVEAILAHELAHIKRYDYLVNIVQSIIETILFFHPAVWWISGEIRRERENCCDDLALQITNNMTLAKALANLEQFRMNFINQRKPQLSMAAIGNKNQLLNRVQRILNQPQRSQNSLRGLFAACILVVCFIATSLDAQQINTPDETTETTVITDFAEALTSIPNNEIFAEVVEENISIEENFEFPEVLETAIEVIIEPELSVPSSFIWIQDKPMISLTKPITEQKTKAIVRVLSSKDNNWSSADGLINITIKKDTSINGKVTAITIVRAVKDKNGQDAELKIEVKTDGDNQTVTVFENDQKLTEETQQFYQKYIDESMAITTEKNIRLEQHSRVTEIRLRESEMAATKANKQRLRSKATAKQHQKIAENRRIIAEERMRMAEEKTEKLKSSTGEKAIINKEYYEQMAVLRKKQAELAKELAQQNAVLAKEAAEISKELTEEARQRKKSMVLEQKELAEEMKVLAKEIQQEQLNLERERLSNKWIEPFKEALINDGILKKDAKRIRIKMDKKGIKVNGKKLSPNQEKKYIKLYEALTGESWTGGSAIHINIDEN